MKECKRKACKSTKTNKQHKSLSWLPAIVIAILPKCPFCIMAYSGAISMCSGPNLYPNAGGVSAYITIGLAIVVLLSIAFNYKGRKTQWALAVTFLGAASLVMSQFYFVGQELYYIGVAALFFGIWFNGSFQYFYNRYFRKFIKRISHT